MGTGSYWHNGLDNSLVNALKNRESLPECLSLIFNMDGLPIHRSSKCEVWPILCLISNMPDTEPIIIGVYCGKSKPENCQVFLNKFVDETKSLLQTGVQIKNKIIQINIKCFVCDTPARSFIKGNYLYYFMYG